MDAQAFQACLRPRDRFWDIPVPKIDSAFDTTYWCPSRPGHPALRNNFASSLLLRTWLPYDWTPRSEAYFVFPLAQGTPGKQCGLAATGVYQPSLRSPWLAAYAEAYCRISSYLQTMANQGYNPLVAIQMAFSGQLYADRGE
ncbi:hypothetical protein [Thiolapillus sp.]|uniref:hypothetical protein n=2 Tax=Thiolapillus sp. TaxID=2017437 RepID=UPI003AF5D167